jgi:hypothetical protein
MPEWEDFFAYGYPLTRIFKFTVPKGEDAPVSSNSYTVSAPVEAPKPVAKPAPVVEDDDEEEFVPAPKPTRTAKKTVDIEDDEDEDDDDAPSLGWMGKK